MFERRNIDEQYQHAANDELRILVIGAGIAGLTAAQMLRRDDRHPVLIERSADDPPPGYMLALMPMVDRALEDLGATERYRDASVPLGRYGMHAHNGRLLRCDSFDKVLGPYGDYRGIARGALVDVLAGDKCAVAMGSTVTTVEETRDGVRVGVTAAGTTRSLDFDLIIVADGMHSSTRDLVVGERHVETVDTGWGGWVAWAPQDEATDSVDEVWGAGYFLGMYPVRGEIGVFLGGPSSQRDDGPSVAAEAVRRQMRTTDARIESALAAVTASPAPYYWSLTDCRSPAWVTGRTVLVGDAAAGFLPTAGIGAGMAMESAWLLCRMLRHTASARIADVLHAYECARRPRVQTAQDNSRQLAKMMFHSSRALAVVRNVASRYTSIKVALKPIIRLLQDQPDPDAIAEAAQQSAAAR